MKIVLNALLGRLQVEQRLREIAGAGLEELLHPVEL